MFFTPEMARELQRRTSKISVCRLGLAWARITSIPRITTLYWRRQSPRHMKVSASASGICQPTTLQPANGQIRRVLPPRSDIHKQQLSGTPLTASNDLHQAPSCLFPLEEGNRRKFVARPPPARLPTSLRNFALIALGADRRRRLAGRSAALPLDQVAETFRQDQGRGAHLDDLDFTPCDEKVEGTSTYARKPTRIGNPHAYGLDYKR